MPSVRERGAYFTPERLARQLCRWAVRSGDSMLDPACGDGVFIRAARSMGATTSGFDIDPASARAAGAACGDFFDHLGARYDAVVGNPPYVHFSRANGQRKARAAAARLGVTFGSGASSWAPFLVAAAEAVRPGGRMAMVIPREALSVDYAIPLFAHLRRKFQRVEIVSQPGFLFPGTLEKVAILKCGPGRPGFFVRESGQESAESLAWSRIPGDLRGAVREAFGRCTPFSEIADVSIGIVTGDKEYFLVHDLPSLAVAASPTWLRGVELRSRDLVGRPKLLDVAADYSGGDPAVDAYLAEGKRRGVPLRYKCAERACWWRPRIGTPPDAFLTYLSDRLPRLVLNRAKALCTNNLHRVTFRRPFAAGAFLNPVTLLSIELGGRVLGDSVLKLEPGDAGLIQIPPTHGDPTRDVDRALRSGDEAGAIRIAAASVTLPRRLVDTCAAAHRTLRDRRLGERRSKIG